MDVQDIIEMARRQTYSSADQLPDSEALDYLNIVYRNVVNNIIEEEQGYFWQSSTADLVNDQNEYRLPLDNDKIEEVFVKYESEDEYIKCEFISFKTLEGDLEAEDKDRSKKNPAVVINDNSLFLMPSSDKDFADGLKLYHIEFPNDLSLSDSANDIDIPRQYHDVLRTGMKQYIFAKKGMWEEKNNSFQEYSNRIQQLKAYIVPRKQWIVKQQDLDLSELQ